ncbi:PQQ-dependent catabolism-associated beta-propeller protein [Dyella sp. 2RAB6]|uniref:PQQ-dependent catabolism-associated beta-propeller protein n=1 Tax=Dyella sp. 2RAB6 TaxID=3232992 RepID=UPI003F8F66A7
MRNECIAALLLFSAAHLAQADTMYVSDEQASVVHVLDGMSGRVTASIAVGRRPRGMAFSPDHGRLYVASGDDDRIDVIDTKTNRVVDRLPSGPDPERFALSPDGKRLYVANERDSAVSFVDVAGKRIVATVSVGSEPEGMAVSPDGKTVICTSEAASLVHFIDADKATLTDSVLVGTRPRDAVFTPDGAWLLVSSEARATLAVFDARTRKVLRTIDFYKAAGAPPGVQAIGIALEASGKQAFVALGRGNHAAEVDLATGAILRYFPVGQRNWGIALSPDQTRVYAANGLSGDLTIIHRHDGTTQSVRLGGKPWGVAVLP